MTMSGLQRHFKKVFNSDHSAAVSLSFQPDNPFSKAAHGSATRTTSLLMKVKRRYRKGSDPEGMSASTSDEAGDAPSRSEYSAEILGLIGQKYDFPYMTDFQYLPYEQLPDGGVESLIERIVPSAGEDIVGYADRDVPSFMLPSLFSRFEKPTPYNYKREIQPREKQRVEPDFRAKLIQHGRLKRYNYAAIITTTTDFEVPAEPHPMAVEQLELQKPGKAMEDIKKLFEKRPLWSRNALRGNIELTPALIKGILCVVAYYFQQGPWRGLWCRMGYDPRLNPEARKYQLLDFRVRKELTDKKVKLLLKKRGMSMYPQQLARYKRGGHTPLVGSALEQEGNLAESNDSYFIMRRGMLPAYHQMFYQLCDLHDDELQGIINDPRWLRDAPDMKTGYYDSEMFRELRDALTQMIKDTVLDLNQNKTQQGDGTEKTQPSSSQSIDETADTKVVEEEEDDEDIDRDDDNDDEGVREEEEDGEREDGDTITEGGPKDGGEESESENEMEMEMLEFMDTGAEPS